MRFLPVGQDATLVECADLDEAMALSGFLRERPVAPGQIVPGARTVLTPGWPERVRDHLDGWSAARSDSAIRRQIEIPVVYDGEDLAEVAALTGLSVAEVVERHQAACYRVAFTGFAPGFAYLSGGDPALDVPRRSSPRTSIPAGSVAVAGEFTGVYPRSSPGGWQLLGRTEAAMWDLERDPPALLGLGDEVRLVGVTSLRPSILRQRKEPPRRRPALQVLAPSPLLTVQDLGRAAADLGVTTSGAMDRPALRAANRAVGNEAGAAALEVAYGPARLLALRDLVVAVTGAAGPCGPFLLADGEELELAAPSRGVYSYVAVRGGIDVDPVLGSRSGDTLSGVGPGPLRTGDLLPVGPPGRRAVEPVVPGPCPPESGEVVEVEAVLGPRDDWFTDESVRRFLTQDWEVTAASNRIGVRLRGERALERSVTTELPSEATVEGAVQVPADGQPVVFTADHPVTGGYPVIACLPPTSLARVVQAPVGSFLCFRVSSPRGQRDRSPAG
ncbi:MAG: carboxyltransferase domain-containing protein [Aeromicrobium sp.]|uniref:5-oxoprolinase subunit B/C family protein n=1 Tax=Aeromicrobium sp. TaxID=1871063 RepID=UPI0039E58518